MNQDSNVNGVVKYPEVSKSNDYLFRVSLKAVILNENRQVLIVKEHDRDWWDIPGGGLDHGETIKGALARELYEEVGLEADFKYESILVEDPRLQQSHNLYQMRITFVVTPERYEFSVGSDSDEIMFINPDEFKDSEIITEQKIYEYSQLALKRLN